MESGSELSSLQSFIKRACHASGKSSKLPAKGEARAQNIPRWSLREVKRAEKSRFLTNVIQRHGQKKSWCGLSSWEARLPFHDDSDNGDVISMF